MEYAEEGDGNFKWGGLGNPPCEAGILANTWKKRRCES